MLEPRRIAARAVAQRMAHLLGESVGQTVGIRTRLETRVSRATRIEVVTEGILTRMLQSDPELGRHRLRDFRRISRAQPQCRSRSRALPGESGNAARGSARAGHVGDARDCSPLARLLEDAPIIEAHATELRGDDALRPAARRALARAADGAGAARARSPTRRETFCAFCRAPPKSAGCNARSRSPRSIPPYACCRCTASSTRRLRMRRSAPVRRAGARSCSRPASPRPASPSKVCGWSSTRGCAAMRSSILPLA